MSNIKVYTTTYCPFCDAAKALLEARALDYEEIDVSEPEQKIALMEKTGWRTVPQVFVGDKLIGGYQELAELEARGDLG